jgi:hypothetical protein
MYLPKKTLLPCLLAAWAAWITKKNKTPLSENEREVYQQKCRDTVMLCPYIFNV